jgi:hypothetical protein
MIQKMNSLNHLILIFILSSSNEEGDQLFLKLKKRYKCDFTRTFASLNKKNIACANLTNHASQTN